MVPGYALKRGKRCGSKNKESFIAGTKMGS
jgi:hypothetical protein